MLEMGDRRFVYCKGKHAGFSFKPVFAYRQRERPGRSSGALSIADKLLGIPPAAAVNLGHCVRRRYRGSASAKGGKPQRSNENAAGLHKPDRAKAVSYESSSGIPEGPGTPQGRIRDCPNSTVRRFPFGPCDYPPHREVAERRHSFLWA